MRRINFPRTMVRAFPNDLKIYRGNISKKGRPLKSQSNAGHTQLVISNNDGKIQDHWGWLLFY